MAAVSTQYSPKMPAEAPSGGLIFPAIFLILLFSSFTALYFLPYQIDYYIRALTSLWSVSIADLFGFKAF